MIQQHPQQPSYIDPLSSSSSSQFIIINLNQLKITNIHLPIVKILPLFPHNHQEVGEHEDWRDESYYSRNIYENHHMRAHDDNNNYDEEIVQSKAARRTGF